MRIPTSSVGSLLLVETHLHHTQVVIAAVFKHVSHNQVTKLKVACILSALATMCQVRMHEVGIWCVHWNTGMTAGIS